MQYIIAFLEGIITFVSPCLLPIIPIYISYFAGQNIETKKGKTLINSIGFVIGFTSIFMLLGALSGSLGKFVNDYIAYINIIFGAIVIIFGLNFMEVLKIPFLNKIYRMKVNTKDLGFFSSIVFGLAFGLGWTPCIGAFLGSALLMVTVQGEILQGVIMLLCFSIGLGIPFIISAILIERLKNAFNFIKKNYEIVNKICGAFLVVIGILMMTGTLGRFLNILTIK